MPPTTTLHPAALDVLASTPAILRSMLAPLPQATLDAPGDEGWSAKDVVAHLLSIATKASTERARLMIEHDDPAIPNMDEEAVLVASGMRDWPLARLLDEFATQRATRVPELAALTAEQLQRTGRHSAAGSINVAEVLNHVAYHDLLHIAQVARLIGAPLEQQRGAMRMF